MQFKKIYIEISNLCNLKCTFCPEVTLEKKKVMTSDEFNLLIPKIKNSCDEICLHLLGEPLLHPELEKIIKICDESLVKINLTTNGILIKKHFELLLNWKSLRQINFSLQSFENNFPLSDIKNYLQSIFHFSNKLLSLNRNIYINYRLWNLKENNNELNENILSAIETYFNIKVNRTVDPSFRKSKKIIDFIYLNFDSRFEWPSLESDNLGSNGKCYGTQNHIGVLADQTVIPCCLDKDGVINLGNLRDSSLEEIMNSKMYKKINEGFKSGKLYHELCQKCSFIRRFKKY